MASKYPVTLSGWYEEQDGGYRYHWWVNGQLHSGEHVFADLGTARLVQTIEELESYNTPEYLRELGWSDAEIHSGVQAGELYWTPQGRLHPTHGTR